MKKLAPLFAATLLALSGGVLANTPDGADRPQSSTGEPPSEARQPEGFVRIQRNIYVPVDSEGKVVSNHTIVIDRQDYVTTAEFEAATKEGDAKRGSEDMKEDDNAPAPQTEEPAASPAPSASPTVRGRVPFGRGPMILS